MPRTEAETAAASAPTFGQFWEMARDAGLHMRGCTDPTGNVMIEMIAQPQKGDGAGDVAVRMANVVAWIKDHGGSADPIVSYDYVISVRGTLSGVRYHIRNHGRSPQK